MNKYIGFDIDSKKIVACIVQKKPTSDSCFLESMMFDITRNRC